MKLAEIIIDNWRFVLSIHSICIPIVLVVIIAIWFWNKKIIKAFPLKLKSFSFSVRGQTINLECDYLDREIAYQSWVEMNTRKIGLPIDEENDVIVEIYNSWYNFFGVIRENLKKMPGHKLKSSIGLIEVLTEVLNTSLRVHLTKWQAKFRRWYEIEKDKSENYALSPQEIQRKYPEYNSLMLDLKATVDQMIQLKNNLYDIAFDKAKKINNPQKPENNQNASVE